MPQLHLYVAEETAEEIRRRAKAQGVPVSRFLSMIVEREVARDWPVGFFDLVVGAWRGEQLERPPQGELEAREPMTSPE